MENKLAIYQLAAPAMGCPTCSQGGLNGLFNSNPDRQAARQAARADRQALRAQKRAARAANRAANGSWFERNNVNADSVVNRVEDMLNLAGGVANVINMFKGGRPINVGGQQLSQAQARQLYESAVAKEEGRLDDYVEDNLLYTDNNANNFMQQYLQQKMMAEMMGGNKPKDNTALYIGLGVGGVVLIAMMMMMMQKK